MNQTVARVKAILRTNIKYGVFSAVVLTLLYVAAAVWLNPYKLPLVGEVIRYWPVLVAVLFILPVLIYLDDIISGYIGGVMEVKRDTKAIKKHLFLAVGGMWSSIACVLVALPMGWSLLAIVASVVGTVAWGVTLKLFMGYVQSL